MKVGVAIIIVSLISMSVSSQLQRDYYHWIHVFFSHKPPDKFTLSNGSKISAHITGPQHSQNLVPVIILGSEGLVIGLIAVVYKLRAVLYINSIRKYEYFPYQCFFNRDY